MLKQAIAIRKSQSKQDKLKDLEDVKKLKAEIDFNDMLATKQNTAKQHKQDRTRKHNR